MHRLPPLLLVGLLAAAPPASAMYLNPQGTGEVLLFPYYTVNAGQVTLVSLTNTTDKPKYLSFKLREGYASREVMNFSIILAPHDSWTGTLYATDNTGRAVLLTRDASCTVPDKGSFWSAATGGAWQVGLFDFNYTGRNEDGGPTDLARTREGHLTVVERAELSGALGVAAGQGGTRNCAGLQNVSPYNQDLQPPGGGLYGNFSIVNIAQGTLQGGGATAIADFADRALFWDFATDFELLTLGARDIGGNVSAQVFVDGRLTEVAYPGTYTDSGPPRPIDAVSALLMAEALYGDFEISSDISAKTEWVITAPTKFMYTDNQLLGLPPGDDSGARPPFRDVFDAGHESGSCMPFTTSGADREGRTVEFDAPFTGGWPPQPRYPYPTHTLCHATDVLYFDEEEMAANGTPLLGSRLGVPLSAWPARVGSVKLELGVRRGDVGMDGGGPPSGPSFLPPGTRGPGLRGLPVIGFQAVSYTNGYLFPYGLANYTRALPLQSSQRCTDAAGAAVTCP